jgi:hypothetical protein
LQVELETITLEELEALWAKFTMQTKEYPMELAPNYLKVCKTNPSIWMNQFQRRKSQLSILGLLETHEIDFYQHNLQPMLYV